MGIMVDQGIRRLLCHDDRVGVMEAYVVMTLFLVLLNLVKSLNKCYQSSSTMFLARLILYIHSWNWEPLWTVYLNCNK